MESGFRHDVQGLRALAVCLVVAYHTGVALPGGYVGVDVFFVISGFVIMQSLVRRWESGGGFRPIEFYGRRVRRLLPALAVMTVVVLPLTMLFSTFDGRNQGVSTARAASLFSANFQLMWFRPNGYFVTSERVNPFLHTWSLSLEEQVYLLVPFLAAGGWWGLRRFGVTAARTATLVGFGLVALASFRLSIIGTYAQDAWPVSEFIFLPENADYGGMLAFYSPVTRLWEFLLGAALALLPALRAGATSGIVAAGGLGAVLWASATFEATSAFPGWLALAPVIGTCALIASRGGWTAAILSSRAAGWIGDRSYSWYLWHWPAITFAVAVFPGSRVSAVVAAAGSLALAELSYRFVEAPIREGRLWRAGRIRTFALASACVAVPYSVATYVDLEPTPELATHVDVEFDCVIATFDVLLSDESCFWPVDGAVGDAVLIGDSQAGHLSGAFIDAAHRQGLNARIVTRTGAFFQNTPDRDELARLIIDEVKPQVVVLGQLTIDWDVDYWVPQVRSYVQRFTDAGIGVVMPHRIRKGGEPLECPPIRFGPLPNICEVSTAESIESAAAIARIIDLERSALDGIDGLVWFDPNPVLCPDDPCRSYQDGRWMWRDGGHISREGARRLEPLLAEAIAEVARA